MARCSGNLLPPPPPTEKATARQDQAREASTGDRSRHGSYGTCGVYQDRRGEMSSGAVAHDVKNLGDIER
jgi:hypothetical protein